MNWTSGLYEDSLHGKKDLVLLDMRRLDWRTIL